MATATTSASFLLPFSPLIHHNHKSNFLSISTHRPNLLSCQPLISCLTLSKQKSLQFQNPPAKKFRNFTTSATSSEDAAVIPAEQIVSATSSGDDGVSTVISILLFIAFVALSILTVGVIYIAVTDFLQKREKEKFEKEEEAKKKKGAKKAKVRARAGPRGFGQKIEEFEDD